ncbi:MAG: tetratricopeptide repeat protein [Acidobacteria bacterium]|nr:tetratricopeptide repeat protein [Acidobacteriota bacterium]
MTDFQLGNRLLASRKPEEAVQAFLRHAARVPQDAANAFERAGTAQLSINALNASRTVAPGVTLIREGDRQGAELFYRKALAHNPNHPRALKGLAHVLPDNAEERRLVLEHLAAVQPDYLGLLDLGDFYRSHRKDFQRAYELYRQAQTLDPRDKGSYLKLQDLCKQLGHAEEALEWRSRWQEQRRTRPPKTGA